MTVKIRKGFVSNSSSSSFVASTARLTEDEIQMLLDYTLSDENEDGWTITVDEDKGLVEGFTSMCNGAFPEWVEKKGLNKIRFEDYGW